MGDIYKGINDEKCSIEEKDNSLILKIPLPNEKYDSITFILEEKRKSDKEIISEQEIIIMNLVKEIKKIKKWIFSQ